MDWVLGMLVLFLLVLLTQMAREGTARKPIRMVMMITALIIMRLVPRPSSPTADWIYTAMLAAIVVPYVWFVWLDYIKPGLEKWKR